MASATFTQDPNEVLDYVVDWSLWLPTGDTIATSTFTAGSSAINATNTSNTSTTATVWVSFNGGSSLIGQSLTVVNDIITTAGRRGERTLQFKIKQL